MRTLASHCNSQKGRVLVTGSHCIVLAGTRRGPSHSAIATAKVGLDTTQLAEQGANFRTHAKKIAYRNYPTPFVAPPSLLAQGAKVLAEGVKLASKASYTGPSASCVFFLQASIEQTVANNLLNLPRYDEHEEPISPHPRRKQLKMSATQTNSAL